MKILNASIQHKRFGIGNVTELDDSFIYIQFERGIKKFEFPEAFEKYLQAKEGLLQEDILNALKQKRQKAKAAQKEATRKAEQEAALAAKALEKEVKKAEKAKPKRKRSIKKTKNATERKPRTGRRTFLVFQGKTFEIEHEGGYLWAPKKTASGRKQHSWERMLEVQKGDLIFHGCNGKIEAISLAKGPCYDSPQPEELKELKLWDQDGRKIDSDYTKLEAPLETENYIEDILRFSDEKYAPFNRNGRGNVGYLFDLNDELAQLFAKELLKQNPSLKKFACFKEWTKET